MRESLPRKVVREMKRRGFDFLCLAAEPNQDGTRMLFAPSGREPGRPFIAYPIDVTGLEQVQYDGLAADNFVLCRVNCALGRRTQAASPPDPIHAAIGAIHKHSKHRI